jgi:hypothetical protein
MQKICGAPTTTGQPCGNVVGDGEDHCRAGHPCVVVGVSSVHADAPIALAGSGFDLEELILGAAA